jgi:hypothetical protein
MALIISFTITFNNEGNNGKLNILGNENKKNTGDLILNSFLLFFMIILFMNVAVNTGPYMGPVWWY